ncbi:uncharacterized protein PHACADRAFT_212764 [Phanerochaete carnosa HHB-10118-sp]|uniref:Uncharacterized protein n=1 Tax=Phanerochaete carnosa (strain HHB-10118-sp) TaxID=650164 RepID=K5UQS8_PHACS|nr:uncharacterized protein PHACADRAFT_212764 [Phanerochaete carnosa HHB-10118-sp]EKM52191.1 hypothetical protein PHACADRAFT_212764 [Phanerochaete carnosa HHB-10118-sp]
MASYPVSYHALRDSIISNASEKKGYNPFRTASISPDKSNPCFPVMLNLIGPSAAASRQSASTLPLSRAPSAYNRTAPPSNNNSDVLRLSPRERRLYIPQPSPLHLSQEGRYPNLKYVFIPPERRLRTLRLTQSSNSWVAFGSNFTPGQRAASGATPRRFGATLYDHTARAEQGHEWDDMGSPKWFSDAVRQYSSDAYRASSIRTTQTLQAHDIPSTRPRDSSDDRHAGYVAVHVYAEVPESDDARANPLCCIAYISGRRKNVRRRLEDEYTVLRLHLAGNAEYEHEVHFAHESFPGLELGRKLSLATLKRMPLAWLTYGQLDCLAQIARELRGGPQSYREWVRGLYQAACTEGLFPWTVEMEKSIQTGPVRPRAR